MIEEKLENLKKDYIKIMPSDYLIQDGWRELSLKLDSKQSHVFPKAFALVALIIFISSAVVASAQAAKPGQTLYPVKILSENVYAQFTGNQQFKIERRAQEVIELSSDQNANLNEAAQNYEQTLEETKKEAEDSESKENFKKILEEQEDKFERELERNTTSPKELRDLLERTQKTRGEVKGKKDEKGNGHNNQKSKDDDDEKEERGRDRD